MQDRNVIEISPEDAQLAADEEEKSRVYAENDYLKARVVNLRAHINLLNAQLAELQKPTETGEGIDAASD